MNSWLSPQSDSNRHPLLPFKLRARFSVQDGLHVGSNFTTLSDMVFGFS